MVQDRPCPTELRIKWEGKRGRCQVGIARRVLGSEGQWGDLAKAHNTTLAKEMGVKPSFLGSQLCTSPPLLDFLEACLLLSLKSLHFLVLGGFFVCFFGGDRGQDKPAGATTSRPAPEGTRARTPTRDHSTRSLIDTHHSAPE